LENLEPPVFTFHRSRGRKQRFCAPGLAQNKILESKATIDSYPEEFLEGAFGYRRTRKKLVYDDIPNKMNLRLPDAR
jgi:hypothetical protein